MTLLIRLLTAICMMGCSGGDDDDDDLPFRPDSGVIDSGFLDAGFQFETTPDPPVPPEAALPPAFTCPAGWRTIQRSGAPDTCDPWPAGGRTDCPAGEAHFPGTAGCAPLGAACPVGEFADMGPIALYVTASTTAVGGDGSMQSPLTSIVQAINAAAPGGVIVLGKGSFDQTFTVDRDVVIMGSCVAETRVISSFAAIDDAIVTVTSDSEIMGLTVGGAAIGVLVESGSLLARDLTIQAATQFGIRLTGGEATVENVVIRDTLDAPSGGLGNGHGISARNGARIRVSRAIIENNREIGIALRDPVDAPHEFRDVAVIGTQLQPTFDTGRGLNVAEMTQAIFERVVFEGNHDVSVALSYGGMLELSDAVIRDTGFSSTGLYGVGMAVNANSRATGRRIWIQGSGTTGLAVGSDLPELASVELSDLIIEDTGGDASGEFGRGLEVAYGADARLERVWIRNSRIHGLFVDGVGSSITATDAFSLETQPKASDGTSGFGALATNGASLSLDRALFARNVNSGASFSTGANVVLRNLVVEDTAPGGMGVVGPCGRGLNVQEGAQLTIERARLSRNREVGIVAHDPTTMVTMSDIVVEETATVGFNQFGSGIGAQLGAHLTLTRALISRSKEVGLFAHDAGTTISLSHVMIRDGEGTPRFGTFGRGINVQTGASVTGSFVRLENNREGAIVVANPDSTISLGDSSILGTRERLCAATSCPNEGAGAGVVVRDGASAALTRFLLLDNFLTGAQLSEGGVIDMSDGDVVNHPVGINVQTTGFDNMRVLTNVRYVDNGVQIDGASLYVPNNAADPVPQ